MQNQCTAACSQGCSHTGTCRAAVAIMEIWGGKIDTGRCEIWFDGSIWSKSTAGTKVDGIVVSIVSAAGDWLRGVSRIDNCHIWIGMQKGNVRNDHIGDRKPCIEKAGDVITAIDANSPDTCSWITKTDKDDLLPGKGFHQLIGNK